jgi:SAM-dependent methyltransferase
MSGASDEVLHCLDRLTRYGPAVRLAGWAFSRRALSAVFLETPDGQRHRLRTFGQPSPDVAAVHPGADHARFDETLLLERPGSDLVRSRLVFVRADGEEVVRAGLAGPRLEGDILHRRLLGLLRERLQGRATGRMLEVGSRARSGILRRDVAPAGWEFTGVDILPGEGVDVVGDAHRLSTMFAPRSFDAVASFYVLEHLAMPWKFVVELNRVLKVGAVGLFVTHQCWPVHEAPWDFFRFSSYAWPALLNRRTGYRILEAAMGEPAIVAAHLLHPLTDFDEQPAYLSSAVLFEKESETSLDWPVDLEEVVRSTYPVAP